MSIPQRDSLVAYWRTADVTGNVTDRNSGLVLTGTGIDKTNLVQGYRNDEWGTSLNGTDEKLVAGDIGTIRSVALLVNPDTTTEEFLLVDSGKDIMVSGGTVTYTGLTATATYVNGTASTTMVAGAWQLLVAVLNADVDANTFGIGWDGTNYGAFDVLACAPFNIALELSDVKRLTKHLVGWTN